MNLRISRKNPGSKQLRHCPPESSYHLITLLFMEVRVGELQVCRYCRWFEYLGWHALTNYLAFSYCVKASLLSKWTEIKITREILYLFTTMSSLNHFGSILF